MAVALKSRSKGSSFLGMVSPRQVEFLRIIACRQGDKKQCVVLE
jgi:hypothetical protein